jgi:hypothetical protein
MNKNLRLIFVGLVILAVQPVKAQLKGFSLGPYAEMAWPTGKFQETNKNGLGAGLSADIKLPGKLGLTGSAGYLRFAGKNDGDGKYPTVAAFPIRAGLKYRVAPLLYLKMEAGNAQFTGSNNSGSAFILSPGIGIRVLGIDIQGKYETWFKNGNYSFWGIRAGLNL